jgi:hypothetical protein
VSSPPESWAGAYRARRIGIGPTYHGAGWVTSSHTNPGLSVTVWARLLMILLGVGFWFVRVLCRRPAWCRLLRDPRGPVVRWVACLSFSALGVEWR